jgi:DNA-binding CsgD family transcriptional regulator
MPVAAGTVLHHVVAHPETTAADIGQSLRLSAGEVAEALEALERELLVVRVDTAPPRWSASPPRAAMQALLARRRAQLASMELEGERLQERYAVHLDRRFTSNQVEVLNTAALVTARYEYLLRSAKREILHLVMPPYLAAPEEVPERLTTQAEAAARGVRFRSVYDADSFDDLLSLRTAREGGRFGGETRLSNTIPMKLVLFDDDAAIMTITPADPAAGSLLIHSPPLLRVLRALFEGLWEHAVPWNEPRTDDTAVPAHADVDPRSVQVLRMMALGMKDDAIARSLGVSRRTVQQVVTDVGRRLGARTRFQIALQAQALGWLADE